MIKLNQKNKHFKHQNSIWNRWIEKQNFIQLFILKNKKDLQ